MDKNLNINTLLESVGMWQSYSPLPSWTRKVHVVFNLTQTNFVHCSPGIEDLTGYTPKEFMNGVSKDLINLIHPENKAAYIKFIQAIKNVDILNPNLSNVIKFRALSREQGWICLNQEIEFFKQNGNQMIVALLTQNERMSRNIYGTGVNKITDRELEVLYLLGDGLSSGEIADKLCISNHTAISHRKHLLEKFEARNTAHLIRKASRCMVF